MTQEQESQATAILSRPRSEWNGGEIAFLYGLIKSGNRERLKALRVDALLNV